MKKTIEITLETAKKMYNSGVESLKQLALDNYSEDDLTKNKYPNWDEVIKSNADPKDFTRSTLSKRYDRKLIILDKLLLARDIYNDGWMPKWDGVSNKYCLDATNNNIDKSIYCRISKIFAFKDEETRDAFLENFKEKLEQIKDLI